MRDHISLQRAMSPTKAKSNKIIILALEIHRNSYQNYNREDLFHDLYSTFDDRSEAFFSKNQRIVRFSKRISNQFACWELNTRIIRFSFLLLLFDEKL